jgi:hypothetical protein
VFAEAIALKITPKANKPIILLAARQVGAVANAAAAKVTHHEGGKFVVEFDSELPNLATLRARGQLILLK